MCETGYGEFQGVGGTKTGCRKPDTALSLARRFQSSSSSNSFGGAGTRETYSTENAAIAVIEMTSYTRWQTDLTAK